MQLDSEKQKKLLINLLDNVQINITINTLYQVYKGQKNELIELIEAVKNAEVKNDKTAG